MYSLVSDAVPFAALMINVYVPAVVGVPEIAPVAELRLRPAGRDPELTDQVTPDTFAVNASL